MEATLDPIMRVKSRKQMWAAGHTFFAWNGAHTVNVRQFPDGPDLDVFSVGDFAQDGATTDDVLRSIKNYLEYREESEGFR